jgi:hypothetical protein
LFPGNTSNLFLFDLFTPFRSFGSNHHAYGITQTKRYFHCGRVCRTAYQA